MLYELREYTAVPGRFPALVKRFNDHTLELFEKRGIDVVFIAHAELGENSTGEIVYLVRWDSYQQLADTWAAFFVDPEWVQVKQDSERDGPVVSAVRRRILNTNPFERQGGDG
ncbi:NIPSNAP family protein [Pseudonocardia sp. KRD-184]|uniref:NIPSNAP family protein n=1 Tax=Pseudonocardia oceani TaxID=2792013 RepID=A0ABS6U203_9PSEU|nr:NIPSNAP family protein [Pseudonocardia oceani]MBW0089595.1 NIPSNAP family protein [Pseudonocardia oceani]MBW0094869.1 NIPSNAP family protein [Pseudonocardia oceani]MBW0108187.1 NIPSNAP family protein [Pseudonocardia oceani]MBW0120568.1 NIPSNAP family protein [Pseudonocardia oceani]MBW0126278.1 NIPSNAP family protein [Pseudonocardia oceani]